MPGTYTVEFADPTKTPITIPPLGIDTSTSLTMLGYRSPVYMEAIWTNFIRMLEHFARNSPPVNPTPGQIWLDTGTTPGTPKFYGVDGAWYPIGSGVSVGTTAPVSTNSLWYNPETGGLYYFAAGQWINTVCLAVANICEYDELVAIYNTDAIAHGQAPLAPFPTPQSVYKITDAQWTTLINRIKQLAFVRELSTTQINEVTTANFTVCSDSRCGIASVLSRYNKLQTLLNQAIAASTTNPLCYESLSPPTAAASRTAAWDGTVSHTVTLAFTDAAAASRYFTTGGKILWNTSLTNPANTHDQAWATTLSSIPNVTFTNNSTYQGSVVTNLGFANLTTVDQQLYTSASGGYYYTSTELVVVYGRVNSTGTTITLTYTYTDNAAGSVNGTLSSQLTLQRVGPACYNNPAVTYPICSSFGIS